MNLQKIEKLIKKYEDGSTSVEEEMELKSFFEKESVPFHLAGYKDLFNYFESSSKQTLDDPAFDDRVISLIESTDYSRENKGRSRVLYPVMGIAASIILLLGAYLFLQPQSTVEDTFSDPEIAYLETKKILMKVSGNLNTGTAELKNMEEMGKGLDNLNNIKSFDEGLKSMKRISVLDKSRDIITQKTNKQ